MKKLLISVSSLLLAFGLSASESAPAFPGAEGHGRYVTGGRGGEVRHVTILTIADPDHSVRHCQERPRKLLFLM